MGGQGGGGVEIVRKGFLYLRDIIGVIIITIIHPDPPPPHTPHTHDWFVMLPHTHTLTRQPCLTTHTLTRQTCLTIMSSILLLFVVHACRAQALACCACLQGPSLALPCPALIGVYPPPPPLPPPPSRTVPAAQPR